MTISLPSGASELAKLYPEKIKQANNIYPLASKFFKGPNALAEGEILTPEMLKDPKRQQAYYKLRRLVGLAIDAGIDLNNLSEFGLIKEDKKADRYSLDFRHNPHWISNRLLFSFFNRPQQLQSKAQNLRALGLSQSDIQALDNYLKANNPSKLADIAERDYLKAQKHVLAGKYSPEYASLSDILNIHEQSNKERNSSWNRWATGLLDSLPTYKQRILVQYLQSNIGRTYIAPTPINKDYLISFEQQLISGEVLTSLNKSINETQEQ